MNGYSYVRFVMIVFRGNPIKTEHTNVAVNVMITASGLELGLRTTGPFHKNGD